MEVEISIKKRDFDLHRVLQNESECGNERIIVKSCSFFEFFLEYAYIMHIKHLKFSIMTIIETIIFIVGWSTMIGIFNYLESK